MPVSTGQGYRQCSAHIEDRRQEKFAERLWTAWLNQTCRGFNASRDSLFFYWNGSSSAPGLQSYSPAEGHCLCSQESWLIFAAATRGLFIARNKKYYPCSLSRILGSPLPKGCTGHTKLTSQSLPVPLWWSCCPPGPPCWSLSPESHRRSTPWKCQLP